MKRALAVLLLSLALGGLGLWLAYRDTLLEPERYRLEQPEPLLVGVALALFGAHLLFPILKLLLLCRYQGLPMRFSKALLVHFAAVFGAVITPGNSGGAPALVMSLRRLGYPLGKGVGVASQVFILDLVFFAWAGPLGLAYLIGSRTLSVPPNAEALLLFAAALAVALAVALSRFPRVVSGALLRLAARRALRRVARRLRGVARDYYRSVRAYQGFSAGQYILLQGCTALGWFTGFLMLWALLALYGFVREPLVVTALLSVIALIANFVPTPGGSGFVEAAVGLSLGGAEATAPVVIWRLFNYYLFFLLGPLSGWLLYRSRPLLRLRARRGASPTGGGKARP